MTQKDEIIENKQMQDTSLVNVQANIGSYIDELDGRIFADGDIDGHEMADVMYCHTAILAQYLALENYAASLPADDARLPAVTALRDNLSKNYDKIARLKYKAGTEKNDTDYRKDLGRTRHFRYAQDEMYTDSLLLNDKSISLSQRSLIMSALAAAGLVNITNTIENNPLLNTMVDQLSAVVESPLTRLNADLPHLLQEFVQNGSPLDLKNAHNWADTIVNQLGKMGGVDKMQQALNTPVMPMMTNFLSLSREGGLV